MLPADVLHYLARRAYKAGATDEALALTQMSSSAYSADIFTTATTATEEHQPQKSPSIVDKEAALVSPVPVNKTAKSQNTEPDSLSDMLSEDRIDTAAPAGGTQEQTGYMVKGIHAQLMHLVAMLDSSGHRDLAVAVLSCLE